MIIEFIEANELQLAWVLEEKPHRFLALSIAGKEIGVSKTRVLNYLQKSDLSDKAARIAELKKIRDSIDQLAKKVDLYELWQFLDNEGELFDFTFLSELVYSNTFSSIEKSAVIQAIYRDGLLFKLTNDGVIRHEQEKIEQLKEDREKKALELALQNEASEWINSLLKNRIAYDSNHIEKVKDILADWVIWGDESKNKNQAKDIIKKSGLVPTISLAFNILVKAGYFHKHENLPLKRLPMSLNFSEEAIEEAKALAINPAWDRDSRLDFTNEKALTIDSYGAKDLDDAIYYQKLDNGNWQVFLHITDVVSLITPDSILDLTARARSSSIYLPENKYPMLPESLSEGALSLSAGEVKPAFSFIATLSSEGELLKTEMGPSLVKVSQQLNFNEADALLNENEDLKNLWFITNLLQENRKKNGAIIINLPKLNIYFSNDGQLNYSLTQWDTPAKIIISEMMILANYIAAKELKDNNYPCPYRTQAKANENKFSLDINNLNQSEQLAFELHQKSLMGKAGFSFQPAPHCGLGLEVYTSFTAPMRRYIDLLVARQLRSLSSKQPPVYDEQAFLNLAMPAFESSLQINRVQNQRNRYWLLEILTKKIGETFKAVVYEKWQKKLRVCVLDFMLEFDLFLPASYDLSKAPAIGTAINVKLIGADAREDFFKFEIAE